MRVGVPGVGWSERTGWASSRAGELAGGVFAVHGTEGVEEGGEAMLQTGIAGWKRGGAVSGLNSRERRNYIRREERVKSLSTNRRCVIYESHETANRDGTQPGTR